MNNTQTRTLDEPMDKAALPRSRTRSVVSRLLFVSMLIAVVVIGFVGFGPPSQPPTGQRLLAMAPPGAGTEPYVAPDTASATEKEIAKQFATVRQYPDTVGAYVLLGQAYLQRVREVGDPSDYERAQAAFEEARSREPGNADSLIGLGLLALARHEFATALSLGEQAAVLAPRSAGALGVVVDALTELGRYDEAVIKTQQMVDMRPDLGSLSRVAYQRELHGDTDGAIEAMARAFDASPGTATENREYIRVLIGDLHLLKGDVATAEQVYRASLAASPGFVWALAGLGRVHSFNGDFADAIASYEEAVAGLPAPELFIALGEAQEAAGLAAEAADTYEVVGAQQQLLAANGVNVDLELAIFEANHGTPGAAVELARQAYESQPNVKAADALAWALHMAGRSAEAQPFATEAVRLGGAHGRPLYHAGVIALAIGDSSGGRAYLERATAAAATLSPLEAAELGEMLAQAGS